MVRLVAWREWRWHKACVSSCCTALLRLVSFIPLLCASLRLGSLSDVLIGSCGARVMKQPAYKSVLLHVARWFMP
jgi:hypothetical protein